jgi:hypothetical protein
MSGPVVLYSSDAKIRVALSPFGCLNRAEPTQPATRGPGVSNRGVGLR